MEPEMKYCRFSFFSLLLNQPRSIIIFLFLSCSCLSPFFLWFLSVPLSFIHCIDLTFSSFSPRGLFLSFSLFPLISFCLPCLSFFHCIPLALLSLYFSRTLSPLIVQSFGCLSLPPSHKHPTHSATSLFFSLYSCATPINLF